MTTEPTPKKPRRRLWLVLGIGLLLCVVLAIIAGQPGDDQPAAPAPTSVEAPAAVQSVATEPAAPTNTPAPPPTDTPPTPAPVLAQIGERVESGGIALTVLDARRETQVSEFMTPAEGSVYLVIEALIENVSRDEAPYNLLYFSAKDSDGFQYQPSFMGASPAIQSGTLTQGDRVRGFVTFEVSEGATGVVVTYEPQVILGGFEAIRVAVDP